MLPDVNISYLVAIELLCQLWDTEGEVVLATRQNLPKAALKAIVGKAVAMPQHLLDNLPQIGSNLVCGVGTTWHFCHDGALWCCSWLDPKQHVPVDSSPLLIFLLVLRHLQWWVNYRNVTCELH